ncbi:FadR/GntR family transcriptional regulator [Microbacterium sp. H1-D42]|uniref:FadR/GntR family transcriptional regulator n=1 Tax=Microbacterium sp. H1-D42 TaxID=2925844 RepID=UPI001F53CA33|nr:FadR/GntR family transcriptional regulator [Microbacterium sp. H1-D42]UNK70336.1 FadR family transcriptional regulator [Microbacterium sp. H1-D42]
MLNSPAGAARRRSTPRGLHGEVLTVLGRRIVRGELAEGAAIDVEQVMAEFGVSRTVVREALRVLAAKGLVGARPRVGTYVAERSGWLLLDTDIMQWRTDGEPDPRLVRELDQVRGMIEPAAAAAAASHCSPEDADKLRQAFERLLATDAADHEAHVTADLDFHLAILAISGNELLTHFEVVLEPAMRARHTLAFESGVSPHFVGLHRAVFDAIIARDPEGARTAMVRLIAQATEQIAEILDGDA